MLDGYTEKAKRVLFFAGQEVNQVGSRYIETEFLLILRLFDHGSVFKVDSARICCRDRRLAERVGLGCRWSLSGLSPDLKLLRLRCCCLWLLRNHGHISSPKLEQDLTVAIRFQGLLERFLELVEPVHMLHCGGERSISYEVSELLVNLLDLCARRVAYPIDSVNGLVSPNCRRRRGVRILPARGHGELSEPCGIRSNLRWRICGSDDR
jgi:hypothetical protein